MPINPIAEFLSGLIKPKEIQKATGLSHSTCNLLINDPTHSFQIDVAQDVHTWFVKNFGECHLYGLFDEANVNTQGRAPYTGGKFTKNTATELSLREVVCKRCRYVTLRTVRYCIHCGREWA